MQNIMMKKIRKSSYREFIRAALKENDYILLTVNEINDDKHPLLGSQEEDYGFLLCQTNIHHNERPLFYKIDYYLALDAFYAFDSLKDITEFYDICRIIFIKEKQITIQVDVELNCVWVQ